MSTGLIQHLHSCVAALPSGAIAVAYSGGLDSTVLLHALASVPAARERGLRALHVDHRLHPDSPAWAARCAGFATGLGVPCETLAIGEILAAGKGIEGAARMARYDALAGRMRDGDILATAQHADDQAETVLLKLLRGAGPEGLGGMRALRRFGPGHLWRPLLEVPRARLREYAIDHGLRWIEDPSNADTRLRRNYLRTEILPRLAGRWPAAAVAIAHSANWARAAADFIGEEAGLALARVRGADAATLDWRGWLALPAALRDPVLRQWLRALGLDEPAHFHVAELERQLQAGAERALCVRWDDCEVRRYRDGLYAMRPLPPIADGWSAAWSGVALDLPDGGSLVWRGDSGETSIAVDAGLQVSYRRGGERIKPAGAAHTRELRLLLQESGIPPWQRDRIPLVAASGALIAVGDLFLSDAGRALCERMRAQIAWNRSGG
jgi:tRNA(Ile)-lysidine synthase